MATIVEYMYIEITRRCNLRCKHCQRGEKESVDLSKEDIDSFLDNFTNIRHITIGGGEPTLNPDMIEYIVDKIIEKKIVVERLGMITNGHRFDKRIADAFNRFDEYIKSLKPFRSGTGNKYINNRVGISFSDDPFHKPIRSVEEAYKRNCPWILIDRHTVSDENIIKTGFATFGRKFRYVIPRPIYRVLAINNIPCIYVRGSINISATGTINTNAEGTYKDHDNMHYGHVSNFSLLNFLNTEGIPARTPHIDKMTLDDLYNITLKEVIYRMGCDKDTIYALTGIKDDRVSYTPVYKKVLREKDIFKKSR